MRPCVSEDMFIPAAPPIPPQKPPSPPSPPSPLRPPAPRKDWSPSEPKSESLPPPLKRLSMAAAEGEPAPAPICCNPRGPHMPGCACCCCACCSSCCCCCNSGWWCGSIDCDCIGCEAQYEGWFIAFGGNGCCGCCGCCRCGMLCGGIGNPACAGVDACNICMRTFTLCSICVLYSRISFCSDPKRDFSSPTLLRMVSMSGAAFRASGSNSLCIADSGATPGEGRSGNLDCGFG
mmetsp:Transcript_20157/g.43604  ORF Transcript_20157/g.43604 Transcript_20157/m.43604 type:complete len:234 (+) Transcript_20157:1338-2039(+)